LSFTLEAAHSRKRILHSHGDSTGKELERVLINKVRGLANVERYAFAYFLDLIVENGRCYGVYVLKDNEISAVLAKATVLATGGGGQIFSRTTNPMVATGDGFAAAYRAGALLRNMEFVQFHPTSLYAPSAPQFLLSEALRGEGGILINIYGEQFAKKYHSDGELAPRDVVSRAIVSELERTACRNVFLDITHLEKGYIKGRFPRIYTTCLKYDIDIATEKVPVTPAAHFFMGGIDTDVECKTNIEGLFAAGEVACSGVHGANRLASNSLLEGLVFGQRAGKSAARYGGISVHVSLELLKAPGHFDKIENPDEVRNQIRRLMWKNVGIIRTASLLEEAIGFIEGLKEITTRTYGTRFENEIKNIAHTALLISKMAYERKCSVGAHFRADYPEKCNLKDIFIKRTEDLSLPIIYDRRPAVEATK
ncbi:MAG: FAD-binding protein, partial [Candidatus Magnetoovum sp. WYHC-5]|nr:FAD-binding protein [Candidatus Magnetoovum sp. WYHC-5]